MVRLWPGDDEGSCCSPGAVRRAQASATALGIPFHVIDRQEAFVHEVVDPFVDGYLGGDTPNPCVTCNPGRLAALVELADELGAARVATGHYARLVWRDGEPYVARGKDATKDQSYMLWAVPPAVLARLDFPLGESTKPEVRAAAAAAELPVAGQPESQEVCFAVGGYQAFLQERGAPSCEGRVVDQQGGVLGSHHGQWRFTIGQRRGLGVTAEEPLYVLERLAGTNEVVAGPRDALATGTVRVGNLMDRGLGEPSGLSVQLRYRSPATGVAALEPIGTDEVVVTLAQPFSGLAPGQSAVFYRDDVVVGGGIIRRGPGA